MDKSFITFLTNKDQGLEHFGLNLFDAVAKNYKWKLDDSSNTDNKVLTNISCEIKNKGLTDIQKIINARLLISQNLADKLNYPSEEIVNFTVKLWGQIRQNKDETITKYIQIVDALRDLDNITPSDLFNIEELLPRNPSDHNITGISSWSKILSVLNPYEFFVYDKRIHETLKLLWVIYCLKINKISSNKITPYPIYFRPNGVNKRANFIDRLLSSTIKFKRHRIHNKQLQTYIDYCSFIKELSESLQNSTYNRQNYTWLDNQSTNINKEIIFRQLTEMSLFCLCGNEKPQGMTLEEIKKIDLPFIKNGGYKTQPFYTGEENLLKPIFDYYLDLIVK